MNISGALPSLAVRAAVLLTGAGLVLAPPYLHAAGVTLTVGGVVLAALWPREIGSTVASAGFLLAWIEATGWHRIPAVQHTVAAAAMLYLAQLSCNLAAWVPIGARVESAAIRRFLVRSAVPVLAAALIVALDLALPARTGSAVVELVGLLGILGVATAVVFLLRPTERRVASSGRADYE